MTLGLAALYSVTGEVIPASNGSIAISWFGQTVKMTVETSCQVKEALLGGGMLRSCRLTIDYGRRTVLIAESSP